MTTSEIIESVNNLIPNTDGTLFVVTALINVKELAKNIHNESIWGQVILKSKIQLPEINTNDNFKDWREELNIILSQITGELTIVFPSKIGDYSRDYVLDTH